MAEITIDGMVVPDNQYVDLLIQAGIPPERAAWLYAKHIEYMPTNVVLIADDGSEHEPEMSLLISS